MGQSFERRGRNPISVPVGGPVAERSILGLRGVAGVEEESLATIAVIAPAPLLLLSLFQQLKIVIDLAPIALAAKFAQEGDRNAITIDVDPGLRTHRRANGLNCLGDARVLSLPRLGERHADQAFAAEQSGVDVLPLVDRPFEHGQAGFDQLLHFGTLRRHRPGGRRYERDATQNDSCNPQPTAASRQNNPGRF